MNHGWAGKALGVYLQRLLMVLHGISSIDETGVYSVFISKISNNSMQSLQIAKVILKYIDAISIFVRNSKFVRISQSKK